MSEGRLGGLRGAVALAVSLSLLAGCAPPVQLRKEQLAGAHRSACAAAGAPRVWFTKTVDMRPDPAVLGAIGGRTFGSAEVAAWVDDELAALASPGFSVESGAQPSPGARLQVRPRILKAYVDGIAATKTAVVVLTFEFATAQGEVTARSYRGQQASMNWSSSESEGSEALRDAAADCFEQLRVDLERMLHPAQPAPPACAARADAVADRDR